MKQVLIIGKNGQLASELRDIAKNNANYEFNFVSSTDMPLENVNKINEVLNAYQPDIVINCGAYTKVDLAESEQESAYNINERAPEHIAKKANEMNFIFIHISTDFVFDGEQKIPYKETDPTNPTSIYGLSKRNGEDAIIDTECPYIIIRTSWLYSSYGNNFVKTMIRLGKERDSIDVVSDQIGSPTYARDLADFLIKNLDKFPSHTQEVYHFTNRGIASWYEFADEIMKLAKIECNVSPISTEGYPTPAKRPKYSVLDTSKLIEDFQYNIPEWKPSLSQCIEKLSTQ